VPVLCCAFEELDGAFMLLGCSPTLERCPDFGAYLFSDLSSGNTAGIGLISVF
jgi:hypothetical protein